MNYGRLVAAAVVATIVDAAYGFLVYGMVLTQQFAKYPGVYRGASETAYMPFLFCGIFVAMLAATWIFAKGYEGGSGAIEGARFGAAVGVFVIGYVCTVNYATMNIGPRHTAAMGAAGFVEWIVAGIAIGLVYTGGAQPKAQG